jgi:hypothetical protein
MFLFVVITLNFLPKSLVTPHGALQMKHPPPPTLEIVKKKKKKKKNQSSLPKVVWDALRVDCLFV